MAKYIEVGDSIECNKSEIYVRKISNNPVLLNWEGVGRFFKYKSKIHALVKITEELIPKICRICNTSNLNLNDELEGVVLEIYLEKKVKLQVIANFSNVHGIQANAINSFTFAKVVIPWRFVLEKGLSCHDPSLEN